jgi:hypothetical protein
MCEDATAFKCSNPLDRDALRTGEYFPMYSKRYLPTLKCLDSED